MRNTRQKEAIRSTFLLQDRPLSPEEVLAHAHTYAKRLSLATVYRNIHCLLEESWLEPIEVPGQSTRYEVAGKAHHHHFLCKNCGGVFELDGCHVPKEIPLPSGFVCTGHDFFAFGTCPTCPIDEYPRVN